MTNTETFELISFIVMFIIVFGFIIVIVSLQWIRNKRSPRVVTMATISAKTIDEYHTSEPFESGMGMKDEVLPIYYIIFSLEGGDSVKLRVSKLKYDKLKKGSTGKLTFQGEKYISFEKV